MAISRQRFWASLMIAGMVLMAFSAVYQTLVAQESGAGKGTILSLTGPVTPASASYLEREIGNASARGEELVILEIDTPGGLVDSMKSIIKSMLASETPVVTYVYPQGARSASAGLYVMYGSHVAAMAPFTNTGSATPIEIGGTGGGEDQPSPFEEELNREEDAEPTDETGPVDATPTDISNEASLRGKIIEDSVAYIKGLAEERGRNAEWAEKAVRPPSASITAREALELGVIEIVAEDLDDLMTQLNGRTVKVASGEKTLSTMNVALTRVEPSIVEQILGFFANPNVAAILFTLGTTGIIVEMWNPGSIFPGTLGVISLILALYSFQVLPYNVVPLALMGVGAILVVVELFTPTFGLAGLSGAAIFGVGLYFLYPEDFRVAPGVLIAIVGSAGVLVTMTLLAVAGSRGSGPLIGQEAIRKREGRVDEWDNDKGEGYVIIDGERWRAKSKDNLSPGDRIKVSDVNGIIVNVKKLSGGKSGVSRFIPMGTSREIHTS